MEKVQWDVGRDGCCVGVRGRARRKNMLFGGARSIRSLLQHSAGGATV